jgi:hypothetical protein
MTSYIKPAKPLYRIAFAYPSSTTAEIMGFDNVGCYFVQCEFQREDGSFGTAPVIDAFGAQDNGNPDLVQHLAEWWADEGPARTL